MMEDEEDGMSAAQRQAADAALAMMESFVVGMLTNHKQLPLDRIHNNLKMFMMVHFQPQPHGPRTLRTLNGGRAIQDPPYDKTMNELRGFLARLVTVDKLENQGGAYAIKSK